MIITLKIVENIDVETRYELLPFKKQILDRSKPFGEVICPRKNKFLMNMKKVITLISFSIVLMCSGVVFTRSGGADPGHSGAPGDATCTSCHGGNVNNAPARPVIKLLEAGTEVTSIEPNTDYSIEVSYATGGASANNRAGFQLVALNQSNQNVGTLIVGTGTRLVNGNQRTYITHSTPRTGTNVSWTATWNSGNINPGDIITLYAASRSNAQVAGISNQAFTVNTPTNSLAKIESESLRFFPSLVVESARLTGSFLKPVQAILNIYNVRGELVQEEKLNIDAGLLEYHFVPDRSLVSGTYIARFSAGNVQKTFRFKKI